MEAIKGRRNSAGGRKQEFPISVVEEWQTAVLRVKGLLPAERLWNRVLTPEEQERLGSNFEAAYLEGGAIGMWMRLRGVTYAQAVIGVGTALNLIHPGTGQALLRHFGEAPADSAEALAHAIATDGLVIQEFPRKAWWQGREIEIDWAKQNKSWVLLNELARQSKAGLPVDCLTLEDGRVKEPGFVRKQVSRLVHLPGFPDTLKIECVGKGTYKATIDPGLIRIFIRGAGETLQEWLP